MRTLFITTDAIGAATLLCFAMHGPIAHHMGYDSLVWKSFSVIARILLLIIPCVLAIHFVYSDRQHILRLERDYRLQDVSTIFLMGMWILLVAGSLVISWIVSVSKGLD